MAFVACVWLLGTLPRAIAQDELPTPPKERNAALLYWQFYAQRNGSSLGSLEFSDDPAWVPDEASSKTLAESQDAIGILLRATSQETCDWGVEYERGIDTIMQHVGMSKAAARTLRADARRLAVAGDMAGATERVVAAFKLSKHLHHQDAICLERTVALAIAFLATNETEWLLKRDGLGAEDSERLFLAMNELTSTPDPFGFVDGIGLEHDMLNNNLYHEVYPGVESKTLKPEMTADEREAKRKVAHHVVSNVVRLLTPPVANALVEAGDAWTKDNAVEVLTGIWDRRESLGQASILLPKLQDYKNSELKMIAHAAEVMALFPEEVQKHAQQEIHKPENKPPRF